MFAVVVYICYLSHFSKYVFSTFEHNLYYLMHISHNYSHISVFHKNISAISHFRTFKINALFFTFLLKFLINVINIFNKISLKKSTKIPLENVHKDFTFCKNMYADFGTFLSKIKLNISAVNPYRNNNLRYKKVNIF